MLETIQAYLNDNWVLGISTPIYIILVTLEVVLSNYQKRNFYSVKETLINIWLNIVNASLGLLVKGTVLVFMMWIGQFHILQIANPYLYWVLLFFLVDFSFYFEHRCEHFSRVLWAVHVTHHSSKEYNLTTGFRSSVFRPFVNFWFFIPWVILGFNPLDILLMDAICQIYGILVHTQYVRKMPRWFETFFVSPAHHRVHHASNIVYLDKNMGMVLILWDRIFGTYQDELETEKVVFGLTKKLDHPFHPIEIITHEWKALWKDVTRSNITFYERVKYIVKPPGWSHDQSSKTAKELRNEIFANR